MSTPPDPYQAHLKRAADLFEAGDVVQAGQIWQAILKRDPAHAQARAGLYQVKLRLDQRARKPEPDLDLLLREGCTLFDLGELRDALHKWERILEVDPGHKLALAYANDARKELGMAPLPGGESPEAPSRADPEPEAYPGAAAPGPPGAEQLVLEGVQLYDMGMGLEAMAKWQRALELDPDQRDAPQYLAMGRRDLAEAEAKALARPAPAPPARRLVVPAAPPPRPLTMPGDGHQERIQLAARSEPMADPAAVERERPQAPIPPVAPPRSLTVRSAPQRAGFRIPRSLDRLTLPPWLRTPRRLGLAAGLLALALVGAVFYGAHRREAALKEAVAAAKRDALTPVSRMVEIPSLEVSLDAVRREAQGALADDPLLSYLRAQEWQRLDPDDGAAPLLLDKARQKMAALAHPPVVPDLDKTIQGGDLETALQSAQILLRQTPDDAELRARARKVILVLVPIYADKERMGDARDALRLGRALYPQDKTWPARLRLLESIKAMAKPDRAPWLQLLG